MNYILGIINITWIYWLIFEWRFTKDSWWIV